MESADVNCLVEMGFPKDKAEQALSVTKGQGIQAAIDWLFAHSGDALGQPVSTKDEAGAEMTMDPADGSGTEPPGQDAEACDSSMQEVACLVCDDCGKKFRTEADAQFHAVKSQHQNFSESTDVIAPLTEDEKREKAALLQEKLLARRKQREDEEKQLRLEREKTRRKTGKEITELKQKHQFEEMKKLADQRKKEKQEEKALRLRLKQQIAEDRANFKAAQHPEAVAVSQPTPPAATAKETVAPIAKEYKECRVQFRLTNGACLTAKFKPDDRFASLSEYVSTNRTDGEAPFKLMTTHPKKEFTNEHMDMTLNELGLVPSSVIIVSKS